MPLLPQTRKFRRQQYKMLSLTMFCYLFFYMGRHNFGWAAESLVTDLKTSYIKIGWISFSLLMAYAIGQLINGNLADRWSPRYMMAAGGLLSVFANLCISFSDNYSQILLLWVLNGYFQSMAWAPGSRLITNWWDSSERGKAFGLFTMAAACSSVLTYIISIILVDTGWRNLFRLPVCFLFIAVLVFFIGVRDNPAADQGAKPTVPTIEPLSPTLVDKSWKKAYREVLGNYKFLLACLSIGFQSMARYALIFWLPLYFLGKNKDEVTSQKWFSLLLPIGMATGAFCFGWISDKYFKGNRPLVISIGLLLSCLTTLCIYLLPLKHVVFICGLTFLAGFFVYGPQSNYWPLCPELLGDCYVGTGIGIMNASAYVFAALGEPLIGYIIDTSGNSSVIFLVAATISLLGSISILLITKKVSPYAKKV